MRFILIVSVLVVSSSAYARTYDGARDPCDRLSGDFDIWDCFTETVPGRFGAGSASQPGLADEERDSYARREGSEYRNQPPDVTDGPWFCVLCVGKACEGAAFGLRQCRWVGETCIAWGECGGGR